MDTLFVILQMINDYVWDPLASIHRNIKPEIVAILLIFFLVFILPPILVYYLFKRLPRKALLGLGVLFLSGLSLVICSSYQSRAYCPRPLVFDGETTKLSKTQIVPTLDTSLQPGKNAIWCASFQAAWKTLQSDVAKEPVELEGAQETCARLNGCPAPEVPKGALYTAAGWVQKGILETIRHEMAAQFPKSVAPKFPDVAENSVIAYGYLESKCKFTIPYFDNTNPITFTDSAGTTNKIRTFGIRLYDDPMRRSLRKQVNVFVSKGSLKQRPDDFVVDLCRDSKDTQVVFACIPFGGSLSEILASVETDIASAPQDDLYHGELGGSGELLVPEIAYRLVHEFEDLKGRSFLNAPLAGQRMDVALQDVMFRLDSSGTELVSHAVMKAKGLVQYPMIGDKPFLIYLKKRGAALPYFVMWVDNSELLTKWD